MLPLPGIIPQPFRVVTVWAHNAAMSSDSKDGVDPRSEKIRGDTAALIECSEQLIRDSKEFPKRLRINPPVRPIYRESKKASVNPIVCT